MSRREELTEDGELPCGLCKQLLPIQEFYCLPVRENTPFKDIWWGDPFSGKQYGRPKSYCRSCNNETSKGKVAFHNYVVFMHSVNEKRIHDIVKAESSAYYERNRRLWNEEHPDQAIPI